METVQVDLMNATALFMACVCKSVTAVAIKALTFSTTCGFY